MRKCNVAGCKNKHCAVGYCAIHYARWRRNGDATIPVRPSNKGGIRKHFMYSAWAGMINRCTNPNNSSYHSYGGKGVTVCERWRDFRNFLSDMGERPIGKTLDRIDPTGHYSPENCRWSTPSEQRANYSEIGIERQRDAVSKAAIKKWNDLRAARDAIGQRPSQLPMGNKIAAKPK